jgi:homeobox protein cut-like
LVEDVQRLQASITKLQETSAGQIARLEEQLDHKRQHIARLEARLDAQRDYDDVKRELRSVRGGGGVSGLFADINQK